MSDDSDQNDDIASAGASRRRVLRLGAIGAAGVVSIRPALASTVGSVLNCEIPVPDPGNSGKYVKSDGTLVAAGTSGAYPPAYRPLKGEEVRRAMSAGGPLVGYDYSRSQAYLNYVRKLQRGQSGFTCYASLQMPRR